MSTSRINLASESNDPRCTPFGLHLPVQAMFPVAHHSDFCLSIPILELFWKRHFALGLVRILFGYP